MREATHSSAPRVLVVDDSESQRRYSRVVLHSANLDVFEAADGQVALDMLAADHFDILLLDLKMPVMDGVEMLRRLPSAALAGPPPLIIVCSSEAGAISARTPDVFEQVSFILQKPIEPSELLNAVALLLETRTMRRGAN